ncbi:MAG: multiheme c-type cytochrome [Mariprofundales bacterium]
MKKLLLALFMVGCSFFLLAATTSYLPANYWQYNLPAQGEKPHDWDAMFTDLHPQRCGQCHTEQFAAWSKSLHSHAFSPGLFGQFPPMGVKSANQCLGCHTPLAEQKYDLTNGSAEIRLDVQGNKDNKDNNANKTNLRHAGVSCAACHIRQWQRFGPPRKGSDNQGYIKSEAHGGFMASADFEQSQFCASCHQFSQSDAINGKPLENTVYEWQQSPFAKAGKDKATCQQCHMPERRHEFRGIHDFKMTRGGLGFVIKQAGNNVKLTITSEKIGHAFPTYVTPLVTITALAQDNNGEILHKQQWEIIRRVTYNYNDNAWQETVDTRLMPKESRDFVLQNIPAKTMTVQFIVNVQPDYYYKGLYKSLLADNSLDVAARKRIQQALEQAENNDYILYEKVLVYKYSKPD